MIDGKRRCYEYRCGRCKQKVYVDDGPKGCRHTYLIDVAWSVEDMGQCYYWLCEFCTSHKVNRTIVVGGSEIDGLRSKTKVIERKLLLNSAVSLSEKNRHDVRKMIEEWKASLKACKKYRKEKKQEEFEKHVCTAKKKKKDLTVYVQRIPQKRVEIIAMLRFMYRSSHSNKRDRDGETIVTSFGVLYGVRGVTRLIASFL